MSEMHEIAADLHAESQVILFLYNRDIRGLFRLIDAQYGLKFMMQQTGEAFEECVDLCAQHAGGIEDARHILFRLFDRYFLRLPKPAQENLLYLAEEVGYYPNPNKLDGLKSLCRAQIQRGTLKAVRLTKTVRVLIRRLLIDPYEPSPQTGVRRSQAYASVGRSELSGDRAFRSD